jgi:DNA-directed RNA polymerase specialized sigma24 family protein
MSSEDYRAEWKYHKNVAQYERLIADAAWKFRNAAEYDDLYQEGLIALWKCNPYAPTPIISSAIFNRMKDWVRYIKRLRHNQHVSYDEIMDHHVREANN